MAAVDKKGKPLKEYPKIINTEKGRVTVNDAKEEAALTGEKEKPKPDKTWKN